MTAVDQRDVRAWSARPATVLDHARIADFLATTPGLSGRKFAADSRDVAENLDGTYADGVTLLADDENVVRGYTVIRPPRRGEVAVDLVFGPEVPDVVVDDAVGAVVARFHAEVDDPRSYLRVFTGTDQSAAIAALRRRGATEEGRFIRARKALDTVDVTELADAAAPGITVLTWSEVVARGLGEQVRRLQYDTFLEHFGNLSKSPEEFTHHVNGRSFTPDFSVAAVDQAGEVVGYVLGSTFTAGDVPNAERSAHTDYIGVRSDQRKRGIGELLLRKVWLAALRRGLSVASLGTDLNNRSNAHVLYERLGYVAVHHEIAHRIDSERKS
jgi:ribosomal protein S18 acetylase RimI-like enzyme